MADFKGYSNLMLTRSQIKYLLVELIQPQFHLLDIKTQHQQSAFEDSISIIVLTRQ